MSILLLKLIRAKAPSLLVTPPDAKPCYAVGFLSGYLLSSSTRSSFVLINSSLSAEISTKYSLSSVADLGLHSKNSQVVKEGSIVYHLPILLSALKYMFSQFPSRSPSCFSGNRSEERRVG